LPIPAFAPGEEIHEELVAAARQAEDVAAGVDLAAAGNFIRARRLVRDELERNSVASQIDALVAELLHL
jgi:hypothetical protein